MTVISSHEVFSTWEDPRLVGEAAALLAEQGTSFHSTLTDMDADWWGIGQHYTADNWGELVSGFSPPVEHAEQLHEATARVERAVEDFCIVLTDLSARRKDCVHEIQQFNARYGHLTWEELPPEAVTVYWRLDELPRILEDAYDRAVADCVADLNGVSLGQVTLQKAIMGAADLWNGAEGQLIFGGLMGLPMNVTRMRVPGRFPDGTMIPSAPQWRTMFFNQDITGLLEGLRSARRTALEAVTAAVSTPAFQRGRVNALVGPLLVAKLGGPHLAPAVFLGGVRSMATAALGALTASGSPLRGLPRASRDAARGVTLPVDVQIALAKEGKLDRVVPVPGQDDLTPEQLAIVKKARGTYADRFKSQFIDNFPVLGDIKGELDARKPTVINGQTALESDRMKKMASGLRGANAVAAAAGGTLTWQDEHGRELREVQRENSGMSADEAQAEARKRAWAQTAGNVGSTAIASAAAGAAVGSAVPVVGTAAGFVTGLVIGYAMNAQVFDDADGDGEKDSAAERVGDAVEAVVKDPGQAAKNLGDGIKDGAKNVATTVAGWFGG